MGQESDRFTLPAMNQLELYVNAGGNVTIKESDPYTEDIHIEIDRSRLGTVIEWLTTIKAEIDAGVYEDDDTEA